MKPKILIIVSSTRENRKGRFIADWYSSKLSQLNLEADFEIFDLKDKNLEIFNEPISPMMNQYSEKQQELAKQIAIADGFVFITAEYNHSMTGSLKNFMDYLHKEWAYKPAAFVGYGSTGGSRAIDHLIGVLVELRAFPIKDMGYIFSPWTSVSDDGTVDESAVHLDIENQALELIKIANALKSIR